MTSRNGGKGTQWREKEDSLDNINDTKSFKYHQMNRTGVRGYFSSDTHIIQTI